ncbi:hypothetical protein Micbo1qcDRAFT_157436 [Microdochium bolleyi]|uniref:DUF3074 domain-containing protein n=1 Tax=Microdochium bolleyi TaxID=196109 RepID=A0A136JEA6_9PEZI|nr:hypothetical protein Micbo1qcDRAFT_157436 [Microdochium bolleyi]
MQEMRHKVGRPVLRDRTFPVLQMTCRRVIASGTKDGPGTRDHDTTPAAAGPDGETPEPPADTEVAVESTGGDDISQAADDAAAAAAAADTKTPDVGNNTGQEFLVVSIPVPDFGEDKRSKLASEANAQVAVYVSVERVRKMASNGQIEWVMATASDAGGVLPMWVQTAAVPTKLWKDVPMLFSWLVKRRSEGA